jgi:hypothetical protein
VRLGVASGAARQCGAIACLSWTIGILACSDMAPARPFDGADAGGSAEQPPAALSEAAPDRLSGTGLYIGDSATAGLAPDVLEYAPRFAQWVDGAALRRFLWLPAAATLDTTDADHWVYPTGTRAWQELSRNGVRVETRFMLKRGPDDWSFRTYHWAEQDDAVTVESGLRNASGTGHDILPVVDCGSCHDNVPDRLLGVTPIQLAHEASGLSLERLQSAGHLSSEFPTSVLLPGDAATQDALGYLHANCGPCHNPKSVEYRSVDLELWLSLGALASLEDTPAYRTAVGVPRRGLGAASALPSLRIAPGDPNESALYQRMASRDPNVQMPPIASSVVDPTGLQQVAAWISTLPRR